VIDLEGHELRVIAVPQGDIAPSTIIHIPAIDTVIGGDVVYNRIHMMLALSGPAEWQKWIDSIDLVKSLGATTIIAGHKQPDASDQDLETILNGSRGYIRDFRDAVAASSTAKEVIGTMTANIPTTETSPRSGSPPARRSQPPDPLERLPPAHPGTQAARRATRHGPVVPRRSRTLVWLRCAHLDTVDR